MRLRGSNELHITTHMGVGTGGCTYRVVYWRAGTTGSGEDLPPSLPLKSASHAALEAMGVEPKASVLTPLPSVVPPRLSDDVVDRQPSDSE